MIQEKDILKNNGKAQQTVVLNTKLGNNHRTTLWMRLPNKGSLLVATGRSQEALKLVRGNDEIIWTHTSTDGSVPDLRAYPGDSMQQAKARYWWENTKYAPNGRYKQNFSQSKESLDWNAYLQGKNYKNLDEYFMPVTIEVRNGRLRWLLDGILLQEQPVTPEIADCQLVITMSGGAELKSPVCTRLPKLSPLFQPVDLSNRYNAHSDLAIPGKTVEVDGIPFAANCANGKLNCVDISQSWFREGNSTGYEEPQTGAFGGRWGGALSGNHTRIQFRVANRKYNCIYLLASCDKAPDRSNDLTAQFYRPGSGLPVDFVPAETIKTDGKMRVIRIPVRTDLLGSFMDREVIELELTGKTHLFRAYPDPNYYSSHGAGLPSGVKVYAMTLGLNEIDVTFKPEALGNVWMENEGNPAYNLTLKNLTGKAKTVELALSTCSYDGKEKLSRNFTVKLPANQSVQQRFDLKLTKFGWHKVELLVNGELYDHTLVRLRPRDYSAKKFDYPGVMFGIWPPGNGGHFGMSFYDALYMAGKLGIDSMAHSVWRMNNEFLNPLLAKYGIKNYLTAKIGSFNRDVDHEDIEQRLRDARLAPGTYVEPTYQFLFAEPGGIMSYSVFPEMYGEKNPPRTPAQEAKYQDYKRIILHYSKAFRKLFPKQKILIPWGSHTFSIAYLQDPDTRQYVDGFGLDIGFFDRLPEMQFHGASALHAMYQFHYYWNKYKKTKPLVVTCEGPCIGGVKPGALTADQMAAHTMRIMLLLNAYGVRHFFSTVGGSAEASSYWAEQHYSGGALSRMKNDPYPSYATQGTLIRHLQKAQFVKWIPTGSLSTYCLQYKNVTDGKLFYVLWTIKGTRFADMKATAIYDVMDNLTDKVKITMMPIFVYSDIDYRNIKLSDADHSDIKLVEANVKLGDAGKLFTTQRQDQDMEYTQSSPANITRFPAEMKLTVKGSKLSVVLPPQKKDRGVMPYYTTLVPAKPVLIPGKARYITMEVEAASDWGRVVYVLRDAKGEKWTSVGTVKDYNCDDTPNASYFNFDGKRLVRFELPSHLEYDSFREYGTTWWGSTGGDKVVDLPLSLEKVFIERRNKAMYVNSLEPVANPEVILGAIYAEYDNEAMKSYRPGAKMAPPPVQAKVFNPIAALAAGAKLPPSEITQVLEPDHYYDGTRGVFVFKEMPGAVSYDIYLSRNADGSGALKLGSNLKGSKKLVNGFIANTDFYAFVVYYDKDGNHSKPSAAFKLNMQDNFANK